MPTRSFRNTPFEQIRIGEPMSVTRLITEAEVQALALVSGEVRPHELVGYTSLANKAAAQAVGAEAIVSGLLNRRLPGPGTRIVSQQLQFQGTIQSGGEVTVTVTATQKNDQDHSVRFDCSTSCLCLTWKPATCWPSSCSIWPVPTAPGSCSVPACPSC